jgi:hypothetical protein
MKVAKMFGFYVTIAVATAPVLLGQSQCNIATAAPPFLRSEAQAELGVPLILSCSGIGTGQTASIDLVLNQSGVPFTSRPGEAILTITQSGTSSFYAGTVSTQGDGQANNVIHFSGIAITDPNPVIMVSGIRANVNPSFVPLNAKGYAMVSAFLSSNILPINQQPTGTIAGIARPSLRPVRQSSAPAVSSCSGTPTLPPGSAFVFAISESFPSAFKTQAPASGSLPPNYGSESGVMPGEPAANSATQFAVTVGGSLVAGVTLYLPLAIGGDGGGSAQLVNLEGSTTAVTASTQTVPATLGTTYYYNVVKTTSGAIETFSLPITTDPNNPQPVSGGFNPTVTVNLAPLAADLPANVPRFAGSSQAVPFAINTASCQSNISIQGAK